VVRQSPAAYGEARSRWRLCDLQRHCPALVELTTLSGVWRRLRRYRLGYKRSRDYLHSPDPDYVDKSAAILEAMEWARSDPEQHTLLYGDEVTCYRQPEGGQAWCPRGAAEQPRAQRSCRSNTKLRVAGALDAVTGEVQSVAASRAGVTELCRLLRQLREHYGPARELALVWDNWPVHYHAKVLATAAELRITLYWLPTYSPWANPIEKVWRQLKQDVLRLHRWSDQWETLKEAVALFLAQAAAPSPERLRYVGLALPV
jgi:transposase